MGLKKIALAVAAAVVTYKVYTLVMFLQPWKVVYNHAPGPCQIVKNSGNGSEDMQLLPNGKLLFASGLKGEGMEMNPRFMNTLGQLFVFDFNAPEEGARVVACDHFETYGTKHFGPHGIGILEHNGKVMVFVVNHAKENGEWKDRIEKFLYNMEEDKMTHMRTYVSDQFRPLNDVVPVGPDAFYTTNIMYFQHPTLAGLENMVFQLSWGSVAFYSKGDARIVAEGLHLANGINMSPDGWFIYVMSSHGINVYKKKQNGDLELVQTKPIPTTLCDNIDVDASTGDLWLGCHPVPYKVPLYFMQQDEPRDVAPSQVLKIRTKDGLLTDDVTEVFVNDGTLLPVSTVAVHHQPSSSMAVGSMDDKVLICKINYM